MPRSPGGSHRRPTRTSCPSFVGLALEKVDDLRYGENPHQRGARYRDAAGPGVLGGAEVLQGKAMSFNNWLDVDAAYSLAAALPPNAAVIVKHNNPCGAAVGSSPADSYARAFACDTVSAFGGIVAFHGEVDAAAADAMREVFTEVVVAPAFTCRGARHLRGAGQPAGGAGAAARGRGARRAAPPRRGARAGPRPRDRGRGGLQGRLVARAEPAEWEDLLFAWQVAWRVKSNAIVLAKEGATVGIGAGQMSRVDSAWIAARKADGRAAGAAMASDAFFPFPDALRGRGRGGGDVGDPPGGLGPRRGGARGRRASRVWRSS